MYRGYDGQLLFYPPIGGTLVGPIALADEIVAQCDPEAPQAVQDDTAVRIRDELDRAVAFGRHGPRIYVEHRQCTISLSLHIDVDPRRRPLAIRGLREHGIKINVW
jgi:hypothetical protein